MRSADAWLAEKGLQGEEVVEDLAGGGNAISSFEGEGLADHQLDKRPSEKPVSPVVERARAGEECGEDGG